VFVSAVEEGSLSGAARKSGLSLSSVSRHLSALEERLHHIRKNLLKDGIFDTFGAGIILRAGGPSAYALVAPESRFDINRPPGVNHPSTR
jgi:hypothetical protein